MHHGFIKTAVATPNIRVADCDYNANEIIKCINDAVVKKAKLLVLPELCITGYTCGDLFFQTQLLNSALDALNKIKDATIDIEMILAVGVPFVVSNKLYNCAAIIYNGNILGLVPKTNIPNYSEYYELRYFAPAPKENSTIYLDGEEVPFGTKLLFSCQSLNEFTIAVEICEDVWVPNPPSISHAMNGATIIINLSAGDEVVSKDDYRRNLIVGQSARLVCGYVYSGAGEGESTTDMVFSGHSMIAENGILLSESELFKNSMRTSEIDVMNLASERTKYNTFTSSDSDNQYCTIWFDMSARPVELTRFISPTPFVPGNTQEVDIRCEKIITMQTMGLKKRLAHINAKTAVVGISGGLDSCLALLVAVRAADSLSIPRKQIVAITMPCFGTTDHTKNNAWKLCECLGVTVKEIPIFDAVNQHFKDIGHDVNEFDATYENSQARERTQVLMDTANQMGGIVIGTGDLSELALGWATYNGDHMSMYGVNSSVPKTLVRYLVKHEADTAINQNLRNVLCSIIDTPISPELLPAATDDSFSQKTEDLVGPYELHDFFLYYAIRFGFSPDKVYRLAVYSMNGRYDKKIIYKWLRTFYKRFFSQQFKRSCMPDGPKIGTVTLSPRADWRMPSDACVSIWLSELDKIEID
ncbi:MAG: NAD(+) synthase [Oscillospiraceae bacterium]|nr:NAD(+) synthase [Oscillospiraceae bacterium]